MYRRELAICAGLVLMTVVVFWRVGGLDFITLDDQDYVVQNDEVKSGLTPHSIGWAFTTGARSNWHPLTWLSHMLDIEMFGIGPDGRLPAAGPHLTNLAFHTANTVLLFLVLRWMTTAVWPSAMVAALFAVHPLHVESVAWVSERKDVLSTFFGLLTIAAYVWYARQPSGKRLVLVLIVFSLGLMAKPMLVTLPCVLLLLDYWPLGRPADRWVLLDKLPLLWLAGLSSNITVNVQHHGGAMADLGIVPWDMRVENALVSYVLYLRHAFWPVDLSVFYPLGKTVNLWHAVAAVIVLLVISALVVWGTLRGRRYLAVGWLWYLGMLVPVIGLVQVGKQSMADRYTYLPLVGIFIMLVWGAADLTSTWRHRARLLIPLSAAVLVACAGLTIWQLGFWADSPTLYERSLEVTTDNDMVQYLMGNYCDMKNRLKDACDYYEEALAINEDFAEAHHNYALVLTKQGRVSDAIQHYEEALKRKPNDTDTLCNLAWLLATCPDDKVRDGPKAVKWAERAWRIHESQRIHDVSVLDTLAAAYAEAGNFSEAKAKAGLAAEVAKSMGNKTRAAEIRARQELYEAKRPYRDPTLRGARAAGADAGPGGE
jgi:protein O-mannosyl-transferase